MKLKCGSRSKNGFARRKIYEVVYMGGRESFLQASLLLEQLDVDWGEKKAAEGMAGSPTASPLSWAWDPTGRPSRPEANRPGKLAPVALPLSPSVLESGRGDTQLFALTYTSLVTGVFFFIFSNWLLLAYKKVFYFCMFIVHLTTILNSH